MHFNGYHLYHFKQFNFLADLSKYGHIFISRMPLNITYHHFIFIIILYKLVFHYIYSGKILASIFLIKDLQFKGHQQLY